MDRIQLKGMTLTGRHGVSDAERARPQDFLVTVEVETDLSAAGRSDSIEDTLDYRLIRKVAREVIEGGSVKLVETLATRIADGVLALPLVAAVSVRVAKRPASMAPIDAAAVHIRRTRA